VVVAVVAVVALSSSGSSSPKSSATATGRTAASTSKARTPAHKRSTKHTSTAHVGNPAETLVTVLNGTETAGLAHRVSGELQQHGYSQASAVSGTPPGAHQATVVQYASGHQGEAEGVAHTLGVSQVLPLESAVASLAGTGQVVVIVGAEQAAKSP
jgi:LytR cell envelope-related transcriptional attenuator